MGEMLCLVLHHLWPRLGNWCGQGLPSPEFSGLHGQSASAGRPGHGGRQPLPTTAPVHGTGGHLLRAETPSVFLEDAGAGGT